MTKIDIQISLPAAWDIESRGRTLTVDMAKLSADIIAKLVTHGLTQKIADNAASAGTIAGENFFGKMKSQVPRADWDSYAKGDKGKAAAGEIALAAMTTALEALYAGQWSNRGTGTTARASVDPVLALALSTAKGVLTAHFKKLTGAAKFADFVKDARIRPYFTEVSDKLAWDDDKVSEWMDMQKASGKRDFMAEADASLNAADDIMI